MSEDFETHPIGTAAELERLRQAVGLLACAKPTMEVRADDPIGMAQEVVAYCDTLRARLDAAARRA